MLGDGSVWRGVGACNDLSRKRNVKFPARVTSPPQSRRPRLKTTADPGRMLANVDSNRA
jgi:hypothetical protein